MNKLFSYESCTVSSTVPGLVIFTKGKLIRSMFPYKRGTTFDVLEFDPLNERMVVTRGTKTTTHRIQTSTFSLNAPYSNE
jgi:hypothetical protein